jgi:hypothetical protein
VIHQLLASSARKVCARRAGKRHVRPLNAGVHAMKITVVALSTIAVSACVAFPTSRTYYEPNPEDGKLSRSVGCTWHRTAKDSLKRHVEGLTISVHPYLADDESLRIRLWIEETHKSVVIDAARAELRVGTTAVAPATIGLYSPGPVYLHFPASLGTPDSITLAFRPGFLRVDGIDVSLAPFRFRKVTKVDIYYSAINC